MILPRSEGREELGGHVDGQCPQLKLFYSFISTKARKVTVQLHAAKARSCAHWTSLNPKWKGKIGLSDPRVAGSGLSVVLTCGQQGEEF
jgi:hypothetical protein